MWLILHFIAIVASGFQPVNGETPYVCDSSYCKLAARIMKTVMNKTQDPCNDFYDYVCENWEDTYPVPPSKDTLNLDSLTEMQALLEIREILEEEESLDDVEPLKCEKQWYKSCMDIDRREADGITPMVEIIYLLNGWPIAMNYNNMVGSYTDWQSIHEYYLNFKDLDALFQIRVEADDREAAKNIIHLDVPSESLFEKVLKVNADEIVAIQKYTEFLKTVVLIFAALLNNTIPEEDIAKDVQDVVNFETALHKIKNFVDEHDCPEDSIGYMSIEQLQNYYDEESTMNSTAEINWLQTIKALFKDYDGITIDASEDVAIQRKCYLRELSKLLNETSNKVIVNYVHWKFVSLSLQYTNEGMRGMYQRLISEETEAESHLERWEICRNEMKIGIGYRYEYVHRHNSENTKLVVLGMVDGVRSEFLNEIDHSDWIDDDTKDLIRTNLRSLKWQIGVSSFFFKRENIEKFYEGLKMSYNYFENVHIVREFLTSRALKRLRQRRSTHKHVRVDPISAKIVYDQSLNILAVSAGQLNVPLINSNLPLSINHGYAAPTIGHLISRTMEREVTSNISLSPWSAAAGETRKHYDAKIGCLADQYSSHGVAVGPSSLDESAYEVIGLNVAYNAFRTILNEDNAKKLPDMEEFTDDQMFFIAYAMKHCQSTSSKYRAEQEPTLYAANEFAVLLSLSNFEPFAKAFDCPSNSVMNPDNKCIL